jgi:hypothetical protein
LRVAHRRDAATGPGSDPADQEEPVQTPADYVARITFDQLGGAPGQLRRVADRLEAFLAGDDTAWTPAEVVSAHQLLAFTGAQVNLIRELRGREARQAGVVHLVDHRTP